MKVKIWKNFKTLTDAKPTLQRRNCWVCCNNCKVRWADLETEFVHMTIKQVNGTSATRFICDECLEQHESSNNSLIINQKS